MTEEEVLEKVRKIGGLGPDVYLHNFAFGEGEDQEVWTVHGDRAVLMYPSRRQQRLERAPMQWEVDGISKRGSVTETLLNESAYGLLPDKLPKAVKWLQSYLEKVPPKLRSKARVRFDTRMEYGDTYPYIEITYTRPETDEEWEARKADLAERMEYHTNLRRQKYERMKAEFEG